MGTTRVTVGGVAGRAAAAEPRDTVVVAGLGEQGQEQQPLVLRSVTTDKEKENTRDM